MVRASPLPPLAGERWREAPDEGFAGNLEADWRIRTPDLAFYKNACSSGLSYASHKKTAPELSLGPFVRMWYATRAGASQSCAREQG
jgi:hypothetical protein